MHQRPLTGHIDLSDIKAYKNLMTAQVDPKLLEILVCPLTKGPLSYDSKAQELVSEQANLAYPIRDGIPVMLVDEARQLDGAKK